MIEKFKEKVLLKNTANMFKMICIFAIALFFIQVTPQRVYANEGTTTDGFSYWVSGSHAVINGYNWQGGETDITIPRTITSDGKTYTVTEISCNGFKYRSKLTSITIPNTITTIDEDAFIGCSGLTKLTIPDSVTSIGDNAFNGCSSLTNLTIPKNVFNIGLSVFRSCSSLENVTISSGVTSIGGGQFMDCSRLMNVTIPDTVTNIGDNAFRNCENLTSIMIPNRVTSIREMAFSGCSSLMNVIIPSSVTSIGGMAFDYCTSLTNMTIPSSVTIINSSAFYGCTLLEKVKFLGNAPRTDGNYSVFYNCHPNLKIYYLYGNTGFTNPWNWKPTEPIYIVKVTYVGNGNTSGTVPIDSNTYSKGDTVTVSGNARTFTKKGYTFAGWNTAANGNGIDYNSGEEFVVGTDNVILYAKWTKEKEVTGVTLDKTNVSLKGDETTSLVATVNPSDAVNKNVTWTSSDVSVAKVDSRGKVTGAGYGTATIKVKTDDGNYTASCTLSVNTAESKVVEDFVSRFYKACLNRQADSIGLKFWTDKLMSKTRTGADVANSFIFSPEFVKKNVSNDAFMDIMYKTFFDRAGDKGGKDYWKDKLNNGISRLFVLSSFVNSNEFSTICNRYGINRGSIKLTKPVDIHPEVTAFTYRFYDKCMGRKPDDLGLNYWVNKLVTGQSTGADMAQGFVLSPEFIAKNLPNTDFTTIMYRVFFNRDPDSRGQTYWVNTLKTGKRRFDVLAGFVNSKEFSTICSKYGIKVGTVKN